MLEEYIQILKEAEGLLNLSALNSEICESYCEDTIEATEELKVHLDKLSKNIGEIKDLYYGRNN